MGGFDDQFIACGGEDSTIKVWHRNQSDPIATLTGHTLTVNSVAWHPFNHKILVSGNIFSAFSKSILASDDHTIRVWGSEDIYEKLKEVVSMNFLFKN